MADERRAVRGGDERMWLVGESGALGDLNDRSSWVEVKWSSVLKGSTCEAGMSALCFACDGANGTAMGFWCIRGEGGETNRDTK